MGLDLRQTDFTVSLLHSEFSTALGQSSLGVFFLMLRLIHDRSVLVRALIIRPPDHEVREPPARIRQSAPQRCRCWIGRLCDGPPSPGHFVQDERALGR